MIMYRQCTSLTDASEQCNQDFKKHSNNNNLYKKKAVDRYSYSDDIHRLTFKLPGMREIHKTHNSIGVFF